MEELALKFKFKNMDAYGSGFIDRKKNFIVTGYFWGKNNINRNSRDGKSTYGDLANRLLNDCKKLGISCFLVEIPDLAKPGGYQIAINMKPEYILALVNMFPGYNIVTIDTDMTFTGYPYLFESKDYDFMGFNWNNDIRNIDGVFPSDCPTWNILYTSGGILMFNDNPLSVRLLERWTQVTDENPGKAEDRTLGMAFNGDNLVSLLRCMWLPIEYFWIPYFYEFQINFEVDPAYQHIFKHVDFDDSFSVKEYNFSEFYKIKDSNIKVFHPEALTSEELAAAQGASSNRVPDGFAPNQVKKKRCTEYSSRFVNIPELYCDNANIKKDLAPYLKIMSQSGLFEVENKLPEIKYPEMEVKIPKLKTINKLYPLIVTVCKDKEKFISKVPGHFPRENICIINAKSDKNLPFILLKVIKNNPDCIGILYIDSNVSQINLNRETELLSAYYDFQCFNDYAYPIFSRSIAGPQCFDANVLSVLTTQVLAFRNNKYGVNLLKLWCSECKSGKNIREKLSKVYNKYMCNVFMRSKWISPDKLLYKNKKVYKPKYMAELYVSPNNIVFDTLDVKFEDKDIYDDLAQCADVKTKKGSTVEANYYKGKTRNYVLKDVYGNFFSG